MATVTHASLHNPGGADALDWLGRAAADYIIYISGSNYIARNGATGANDFTSTDAGAVVQSAITALGAGGGTIRLLKGAYTWTTTPGVPSGLTGTLSILGSQGTIINLTSTGSRFLDFDTKPTTFASMNGITLNVSTQVTLASVANLTGSGSVNVGNSGANSSAAELVAYTSINGNTLMGCSSTSTLNPAVGTNVEQAYQTFQNIEVAFVTIDGTNASVTGKHHVIIGSYIGTRHGTYRANFQDIFVHDVVTRNITADVSGANTTNRYNIWITSTHKGTAEATQTTLKRLNFQRLTCNGGNVGVFVGGVPVSGTGVNVFYDDIYVDGLWHTQGSPPPGTAVSSANFQVGSYASGGSVTVRNVHGYYSSDVGIEIDNPTYCLVENVTIEDAGGNHLLITNYSLPANLEVSKVVFRNCHSRKVLIATGTPFCVVDSVTSALGQVTIEGCTAYRSTTTIGTSFQADTVLNAVGVIRELVVRDFKAYWTGFNYTSGTALSDSIFYINTATSETNVVIDNIGVSLNGTRAGGAGAMTWNALRLEGLQKFSIKDVRISENIAGLNSGAIRCVLMGSITGSQLWGTLRGIELLSTTDTNATGIRVQPTTTLAIPFTVRVEDCDFSRCASGNEVLFVTDNKDKFWIKNIRWQTTPKLPSNITVTASPFVYRNLDSFDERLVIQNGTVGKVEWSRDGATYYDLGISQQVTLENGEYMRLTYTSAPTLTKIPSR